MKSAEEIMQGIAKRIFLAEQFEAEQKEIYNKAIRDAAEKFNLENNKEWLDASFTRNEIRQSILSLLKK